MRSGAYGRFLPPHFIRIIEISFLIELLATGQIVARRSV